MEDIPQPKRCTERARKTLPKGLEIKPSRIHGNGVFARKRWRERTRFGPYQGTRIRDEEEVEDPSYTFTVGESTVIFEFSLKSFTNNNEFKDKIFCKKKIPEPLT